MDISWPFRLRSCDDLTMNAAVITGLVGALVGASVSIFTTWLTQRSQLQRELAQRRFGELTRWTSEKRMMFRDIHVATNDWSHLLRRMARDDGRGVSDEELREVERLFTDWSMTLPSCAVSRSTIWWTTPRRSSGG
jgi:hypothetical protein